MKLHARFEFKIEDMWLGLFWRVTDKKIDVWICLLPCLPLHITVER